MEILKKINSINKALEHFENVALMQANATEIGDYALGNKYYKEIFEIVNYLRINDGIKLLAPFLTNKKIGVKMWAAYFLLPYFEKESISVLDSIKNSSHIHSLTAELTIDEWKNGNLNF